MDLENTPVATMADSAPTETAAPAEDTAPAEEAAPAEEEKAPSMADGEPEPPPEDAPPAVDETAPAAPPAPPAPVQDAPPAWLAPIIQQNQALQQALLQQQQESQRMWAQLGEQARAQQMQRQIQESRPKPPGPDATEAERGEYYYRLARWEQDQQVTSIRGELQSYTQKMEAMLAERDKAAREREATAQRSAWQSQYDAYMHSLSMSKDTAWVNTDQDARAVFDTLYNDMCRRTGGLVDPLPLARALGAKLNVQGPKTPERQVATDKLKADRSKQAARKTAVGRPGATRAAAPRQGINDLLRKYNVK